MPKPLMQDYDWAGWSKWISLAKMYNDGFSMLSEGAGAYVIGTTALQIPRVFGRDKHGLLYAGESSDLRSRIRAFYDCVQRGHQTHTAGWQYNLVGFERCAPVESLRVRWWNARTRREALDVQIELLHAYAVNHCELPPLNCSISRELTRELGFRLVRKGA